MNELVLKCSVDWPRSSFKMVIHISMISLQFAIRNSESNRINYLFCNVLYTVGFNWNTWLLTAKLCSKRNGGNMIPSRTGKVSRSSSSSVKLERKKLHFNIKFWPSEATNSCGLWHKLWEQKKTNQNNHMQNLLCIGCGLISGFGLTYGVNDVAGVSGGVGFPGTGLCW